MGGGGDVLWCGRGVEGDRGEERISQLCGVNSFYPSFQTVLEGPQFGTKSLSSKADH